MANSKISALTAATTPVAGTEVLPIVQSSATVQVSVANLTAGRSVSMSAATISSGNLTFSTTGQRITGDFSNATIANRALLQSSTVNGATDIGAIPNGTATLAQLTAWGSSSAANCVLGAIRTTAGTDVRLISSGTGTFTFLPMTFYTGGSERVRIDTSGNVRVTSAGGGLGYGTGAGGTVTQATDKSTTVTLNKPTGQITMNNAALLPTTQVGFVCNNSLVAASDLIVINTGASFVGNYTVRACGNAGNFIIYVKNETAGSLSEAVTLSFAIIKGATA